MIDKVSGKVAYAVLASLGGSESVGSSRRTEADRKPPRHLLSDAEPGWSDDQRVAVDGNLISSRHPDEVPQFIGAIQQWIGDWMAEASKGSIKSA